MGKETSLLLWQGPQDSCSWVVRYSQHTALVPKAKLKSF